MFSSETTCCDETNKHFFSVAIWRLICIHITMFSTFLVIDYLIYRYKVERTPYIG